jgi:hypothetical protein
MSAFIVSNETLISIRNKILLDRMRLRPENVSFDAARAVVMGLPQYDKADWG